MENPSAVTDTLVIDPIQNQQSPWIALAAWTNLDERLADLEEFDTCACREFDPCRRCQEMATLTTEQNRLKNLYADWWIRNLWARVAGRVK